MILLKSFALQTGQGGWPVKVPGELLPLPAAAGSLTRSRGLATAPKYSVLADVSAVTMQLPVGTDGSRELLSSDSESASILAVRVQAGLTGCRLSPRCLPPRLRVGRPGDL